MAKESPFKNPALASAAPVIGVGLQAVGMIGGKRARKRARRQARQATEQQLAFQREQLAALEKQKDVYKNFSAGCAGPRRQLKKRKDVYKKTSRPAAPAGFSLFAGNPSFFKKLRFHRIPGSNFCPFSTFQELLKNR